jgi:hypothetical protein
MVILRLLVTLACLVAGLAGLSDWLVGSGDAMDDSPRSAGTTATFVIVLLLAVSISSLYRISHSSPRLRWVQNLATIIFLLFVLATVNSLGAWLLVSAGFATLAWLISREPAVHATSR